MKRIEFRKCFVAMFIVVAFPLCTNGQDLMWDVTIPCQFIDAKGFSDGLARVKQEDRWGFIDKTGKIVLPCIFWDIKDFSDGLAAVYYQGKWGYIDKTGRTVVPCQFDYAETFSNGLAAIKQYNKWGYINKTGRTVIPCQFDYAETFSNGLAAVKQNGQWIFIDKAGKVVIACQYPQVKSFSEGLAAVMQNNGEWGFIVQTGKVVIPCQFDYVSRFSDGLASVRQNGKWGFIDKTGKVIIPCQFDTAETFSGGLARRVLQNLKWGFIDKTGKVVIPCQFREVGDFSEGMALVNQNGRYGYIALFRSLGDYVQSHVSPLSPMSEYIKASVERDINIWQKKGEFENTGQWQERVNEGTRRERIDELTNKYKEEYAQVLAEYKEKYKAVCADFYALREKYKRQNFNADNLKLSAYDADNESYMISSDGDFADILLPVPVADAPAFKQNWETIKKAVDLHYVPNGDDVALVSVTFTNGSKKYTYDGSTNVKYAITDVDYNFKPIEIALNDNTNIDYSFDPLETMEKNVVQAKPKEIGLQQTQIDHKKLSVGDLSDVDINIPVSSESNSNTFAVIIGNENYQQVSKVQFARNDAVTFAEYSKKTLGVPEKNILSYDDATFATMVSVVKRIQDITTAYKGEANVIFYYAGHGIPNESTGDAFLLPTDADGKQLEVCYSLNRLYSELGGLQARSVTVFMDACFSGSERGNKMLVSARGVALKAKPAAPEGKMVVFSAASGDETAYPYMEKGHGLFTYFLLKKLQETKGNVSLMELGKYIKDNVAKESIVSNGKSQTPTITPSPAVADNWQNMTLK